MSKRKQQITAITVLKEMDIINRKIKSPAMGKHIYADKTINDNSANGIMKCIEKFHFIIGGVAERIHTQGRKLDNREVVTDTIGRQYTIGSEQYIPTTGRKGTADMSITYAGLNVKVEVKYNKDRQSKDQAKYQQDIENAGGVYIIVKSFQDYLVWFSGKHGRHMMMQKAINNLS